MSRANKFAMRIEALQRTVSEELAEL